jgi:hypothetical protein
LFIDESGGIFANAFFGFSSVKKIFHPMVASYNLEGLPLSPDFRQKGSHSYSLNHISRAIDSKKISSTLPFYDRRIAGHRLNRPYFTSEAGKQ